MRTTFSSSHRPDMNEILYLNRKSFIQPLGGGRVVRRCWVNFQCRDGLLIWIIVEQAPIALAVGAGGDCLDIFTLVCFFFFVFVFSFLSISLSSVSKGR